MMAPDDADPHLQRDQPPGVPPLRLTGERTLPDVPAENYWFRRHLAVYEWIAQRVAGRRVVDLACGEGYGSAVLARSAASVVGVDANEETYEHARLRYRAENLRFERAQLESWAGHVDCVVLLQTIEHVQDADAVLAHLARIVDRSGIVFVTTPNVLTLAPGAERSDNPWHLHEYRPREFEELCARHFDCSTVLGLHHARRLRLHELALRHGGWDAIHTRSGLTKPFYHRFIPSISTRDFRLYGGRLETALDFLAVLRGGK